MKPNDYKVRSFMFAFTGPSIHPNVMQNKIRLVEVGVLDGIVKYCHMRMFQAHGRRESCLPNIVQEYNTLVGCDAITLVALYGLPAMIPENKYPRNPLELQLLKDRRAKPPGFESWKNMG